MKFQTDHDVLAPEVDAHRSTVFVWKVALVVTRQFALAKVVRMMNVKKPLKEELNRKNSCKLTIQGKAVIVERTTARRTTVYVIRRANFVTLRSATALLATTTRMHLTCQSINSMRSIRQLRRNLSKFRLIVYKYECILPDIEIWIMGSTWDLSAIYTMTQNNQTR